MSRKVAFTLLFRHAVGAIGSVKILIAFGLALPLATVFSPVSFSQEAAQLVAKSESRISVLSWLIQVSGLIGGFILLLSLYFVALAIKSFLEISLRNSAPPETVAASEKLIEEKNIKDLVKLLEDDGSFYSESLLAGIQELRFGLDDAREKLERTSESLTGKLERSISNLAVIGTLGPMIGLLGTLKGMISSFSVIAMSGVALEAAKVAEGISEALVLTFEGVILSVPAIYFYSLFRNRISQINIEATALADEHLRRIARTLKNKTPESAT